MRYGLLVAAALLLSACGMSSAGVDAYNEGVQHQQRGETVLAEQQFKIALQQDPQLAEAHLNLGVLYLQDNWLEGAEQEMRQTISLLQASKRTVIAGATYEQTLSLAYSNLAAIEARQAVSELAAVHLTAASALTKQARSDLDQAVRLDPTNSKAQGLRSQLQ